MSTELLGELVPIGGGDAIPLGRAIMTVGRRESNDICLRFANVSGQHCEFVYKKRVLDDPRSRQSKRHQN